MTYDVLLAVTKGATETGRFIRKLVVCEGDALSGALTAEAQADLQLEDQNTMYTHAVRVRPVVRPMPAASMPLALAA